MKEQIYGGLTFASASRGSLAPSFVRLLLPYAIGSLSLQWRQKNLLGFRGKNDRGKKDGKRRRK